MAIAGGVETIDCWHPLFGYLGIQGLIRYSIRENRVCGSSGVARCIGGGELDSTLLPCLLRLLKFGNMISLHV
jgi:hypothetical protein